MFMIWASWKSLVRIKLRPSVADTRDMTDVLSRSVEWYLGSGMSPMKRKMVTHNANAAYLRTANEKEKKNNIRMTVYCKGAAEKVSFTNWSP